jgi:four helix bundle protein
LVASDINSYKDLLVWQQSVELAVLCYEITRKFPRADLFGITNQLRRSSASVAANIAEGHGRESSAHFVQFLKIAQGSLKETETHIIIAGRLELGSRDDLKIALKMCEEIGKMTRSLIRAIQARK